MDMFALFLLLVVQKQLNLLKKWKMSFNVDMVKKNLEWCVYLGNHHHHVSWSCRVPHTNAKLIIIHNTVLFFLYHSSKCNFYLFFNATLLFWVFIVIFNNVQRPWDKLWPDAAWRKQLHIWDWTLLMYIFLSSWSNRQAVCLLLHTATFLHHFVLSI